jgi:hypothetical protein
LGIYIELALLNGVVYASYGGNAGDCGSYHGWVIGVPLNDPSSVTPWASAATGCGSWSVGGIATDETNLFIATGNSKGASVWSGGDAIIRLQPGPVFSGSSVDYWAPTNWPSLDSSDLDLGGSGPLLVDVPGATPAALAVALGKDGNAYLLDRTNLGGVTTPLTQSHVSSTAISSGPTWYEKGRKHLAHRPCEIYSALYRAERIAHSRAMETEAKLIELKHSAGLGA